MLSGHPLQVQTSLNVIKIAQFDEYLNTITLNIELSVKWNDTRITIADKYVPYNLFTLKFPNCRIFYNRFNQELLYY